MPILFNTSGQSRLNLDESDIERKKKLSELLRLGLTQPNQSAIASGSPLIAAAAPILQALASRKAMGEAQGMQQKLSDATAQDFQRVMQAGQGTPAQPGQPFVDEQAQFMGVPSPEGLKSTPDIPAQPGSREAMVQAMLSAQNPQLRMAGLQQALTPKESWETVQGPRGSLLQRNARTGEMKSLVGTTDPTLMQMLMQQQMGRGEAVRDPNAPWKRIQDPKKQDEARIRFGTAADARVAKEQEEVGTSRQIINDLDRFMFLNESTETGAKYKVPGAQFVGTAISDEVAEMKSITDKMTPMMRQGMPGAASDRDVAMFRGATVGLEKPKPANANIAVGLKAAHQNKVDRANFLAEYVTEYGHDRGADAKWKQYLEANPIFDHNAPKGSYKLNENRMGFQEWLQSGGKRIQGPGSIAPQAQKQNSGGLSAQEQAELEQLRKELNRGR